MRKRKTFAAKTLDYLRIIYMACSKRLRLPVSLRAKLTFEYYSSRTIENRGSSADCHGHENLERLIELADDTSLTRDRSCTSNSISGPVSEQISKLLQTASGLIIMGLDSLVPE